MGFIQNYFDLSAFYKTNITLTQTSFLICNEDDMQSPKNSVFTRDTFGGSRLKNVWDKVSIINKELEFILDKNTNYNTKNTFVDKKLLIDLKLNKITEKTNVNLQPIAKKASQQSNQSDEHKSPQFQITPNSKC